MLLAERLAANPDGCAARPSTSRTRAQLTVLELVERILRPDGTPISSRTYEARRPTRSAASSWSAAKARSVLGWEPLFSLDEGLERTIAWYREASGSGGVTVAALPLVRLASTSRRSCRSARRRSRTRSSHRSSSTSRSRATRWTSPSAPAARLVQITETVPPETCSATTSTSRPSPTRCCGTPQHARRRARRRAAISARRASWSRSPATTATCSATIGSAGCRSSASSRRETSRRSREERGIPTIAEFFGTDLAERLVGEGTRADVIHAHNVLAHVAELNGFVAGIATLLVEDGVAVIEVPYVKDMLDRCEFDTIYHEHLCYFSLTALDTLVRRHGLGSSTSSASRSTAGRCACASPSEGASEPTPAVSELLAEEQRWGVADVATYRAFAAKVHRLEGELVGLLQSLQLERSAHRGATAPRRRAARS